VGARAGIITALGRLGEALAGFSRESSGSAQPVTYFDTGLRLYYSTPGGRDRLHGAGEGPTTSISALPRR